MRTARPGRVLAGRGEMPDNRCNVFLPARSSLRAKSVEISFTPVDNQRLANLCGALDENLRSIESALDIAITRRGERFLLSGVPERTAQGAQALERLYAQAGEHVSPDDIQLGLVEVRQQMPAAEAAETAPLLTRKGDLRGRTPRQVQYLQNIQTHDITFSIGPAGTGKTYLAVACAVDALERDRVKRIVLVRPAVEAGERLGFLPGDMAQKVDPYLRPLYDALYDLMGFDKVGRLFERGTIEIAPLAFLLVRTLNHSFIILD
jgi:phosphate starvation-inducible PhoH-like protein